MVPKKNEQPHTKLGQVDDDIASIHARVKLFEYPFAHQVLNSKIEIFCSFCMRPPVGDEKLMKCSACNHARYCNKECQRLAWKLHRNECKRLQKVFPNLPLTEVLFQSKIIDRVLFLKDNGDKYGWERERQFQSLMDHKDEIRQDSFKMDYFEKILNKMTTFRGDEMPDRETFFDIFCKVQINSHSIHTNAGNEAGMALDLGVSKFNHSCRPTCSMVFDGFRVVLRPLVPGVDTADFDKAFISYIDVGRSKYVRRKELKARWFFDCECSRCTDSGDDILTAIRCSNPCCEQALVVTETSDPCYIACPKCGSMTDDDTVKNAQQLMLSLPAQFDPECPADKLREMLSSAESILHPMNVYIARLRTALYHITGSLEENISNIHKQVYENYKLCFPKADRHVGYQLLHIVKALIEQEKRDDARPYAFDAMNIFEVCFGLDHPYYLQTLALWTYLDQQSPKTKEELISLTNFNDNRRINIEALLEKASQLSTQKIILPS
ncbi:unnamed protein product, partial [Mesorhabditis belari]|uniref:MYND-type domain-containing protein n=1 Tax=Mesorhabditis belari TaxID=2138241 RepID=A0AAF3F6N1_9BILA